MMATTGTLTRTAFWAIALFALVAAPAHAQAGGNADPAGAARPGARATAARLPDMRLWSFGDCERNFPHLNSDERKECVRVVGSEEAREARAFHVCDMTNEKDRVEAERCKAAFLANKTRAAQEGLIPNRPAQPQEPLPPEVLQRVRVIAENAVEVDRPAASSGDSGAAPASEGASAPAPAAAIAADVAARSGGSWSPSTFVTIIGFIALALLLGFKYRGRVAAR
jgi:hypothetical protein